MAVCDSFFDIPNTSVTSTHRVSEALSVMSLSCSGSVQCVSSSVVSVCQETPGGRGGGGWEGDGLVISFISCI